MTSFQDRREREEDVFDVPKASLNARFELNARTRVFVISDVKPSRSSVRRVGSVSACERKLNFQALSMFHLHIKSPISLENRFGLDLGTRSSML